MIKYLIFSFVLFYTSPGIPQQFINWKNHTDMKNVLDVRTSSSSVWAATSGGAFRYSKTDDSFLTLNKAEGLAGISLTSLVINEESIVWFGSADGTIDVYNPQTGSFKVILDIFNSNQVNKRINDLKSSGDTIIVSSDFGVSLIDSENFIFFDTFFKFGSFPSNSKVNSTTKLDLLYVCTDEGIAIQKPTAVNLSAPESWNVYNSENGLPSNNVFKADRFLGNIIASTDAGIVKLEDTVWVQLTPLLSQNSIDDFEVIGDSLLILSGENLYLYTNSVLTTIFSSSSGNKNLSYTEGFGIAVATESGVLNLDENLSATFLVPNGPAANQFPSISVDGNGRFYSASGRDGAGVGFYRYDKTFWQTFNTGTTPELPSNDVYHVYTSPDNIAYLGTWGRGFLEFSYEQAVRYNRENSGMQGIPANPDFLVITGFENDSRNNLWVLNYWAADRNVLSMKTPENEWYHFSVVATTNRILRGYGNLSIDQFDTKWFSSNDASRSGLFYFNENKTYEEPNDDKSEFISTAQGLNSNDVRAIAVDRRGDVWVGTTLGVNVLSNTSAIPTSPDPLLSLSSVFTLRQQSINAILVDPLNQKWIGTNEGLLLVNSDGSRLLATLDSKNSPLLSDRVQSLAMDENAGIIYVGTEEGLTSFETPFIKPLESFSDLFVYPNPFSIKDNSRLLTIDGLIRDTDIKILSVSGKLVAEFSSPGGRTAFWNGTDLEGKLVSSGVYIIVAFDVEGNNITTGKVAVLRE